MQRTKKPQILLDLVQNTFEHFPSYWVLYFQALLDPSNVPVNTALAQQTKLTKWASPSWQRHTLRGASLPHAFASNSLKYGGYL